MAGRGSSGGVRAERKGVSNVTIAHRSPPLTLLEELGVGEDVLKAALGERLLRHRGQTPVRLAHRPAIRGVDLLGQELRGEEEGE